MRQLSPRSAVLAVIAAGLLLAALCSSAQAAFTVFDMDQSASLSTTVAQTGRLTPVGTGSACGTTKALPALTATTATFNAYLHTLTSRNTSPACLTFAATPTCTPATALYSVFYDGTYASSFPYLGYLGDGGAASASTTMTGSVLVPANSRVEWAVGPTTASTYCNKFHAKITSSVPLATLAPEIDGPLGVGVALDASRGSWITGAASSYSESWRRCDADGASCVPIPGATASGYTPTSDDVGHTLRVEETVASGGQTSSSDSDKTEVVPGQPPRAALLQSVSQGQPFVPGVDLLDGSSADDDVLPLSLPFPVTVDGAARQSAFVSTNGNIQFADDDKDTDNAPTSSCLPSEAFTNPTFAPFWNDLYLATAGGGVYTATTGTAPHRTFVIEWRGMQLNGNAPIDVEALLHEDSATLSAVYADVGDGGSFTTIGEQDLVGPEYVAQLSCGRAGSVQAGTELDITPSTPTIAGTPQAGQALAVTDAQWVGAAPTIQRQWQLCDAAGNGCSNVPGETGLSFTPSADAVGRTARLVESATNGFGSASSTSVPTAAIVAAAPGGGGGGGRDGTGGGGSARGASTRRAAVPVLSKASLSARVLHVHGSVKLRFTSSLAGRATVVVARKASGRRVGRRCVAPTRANRKKKACTRFVTARTVKPAVKARRAVALAISGRKLTPGSYHVVVMVTSSAKARSRPKTLTVTVRR